MVFSDGVFNLQPHHFETGTVTAQEWEAFTGIPVFLHDLSAFAHAEKILKRESLSSQEQQERGSEVLSAQREVCVCCKKEHLFAEEMEMDDGLSRWGRFLAEQKTGCLAHHTSSHLKSRFVFRKAGLKASRTGMPFFLARTPNKKRSVVVCGQDDGRVELKESAHYFYWKNKARAEDRVAPFLFVGPDEVKAPYSNSFHLLAEVLHEMRHALQVMPDPRSLAATWAAEIDADTHGFVAMKKAGCGEEAKRLLMLERYGSFLFVEKTYAFAPALEAALDGKQRPEPEDVLLGRACLHKALAEQIEKIYGHAVWKDFAQESAAVKVRKTQERAPLIVFKGLQVLCETSFGSGVPSFARACGVKVAQALEVLRPLDKRVERVVVEAKTPQVG